MHATFDSLEFVTSNDTGTFTTSSDAAAVGANTIEDPAMLTAVPSATVTNTDAHPRTDQVPMPTPYVHLVRIDAHLW
ncbi:hypothetical protein GCM10023321_49250 [Pseudonocardia eucalypti]|uniref:Uncharacterized protein n=1 Tax=Pseudonocardia eucalypti TaxID=648755 RepID=A0ABP9QJN3_9PSEU